MDISDNNIKQIIVSTYSALTNAEQQIADFFLQQKKIEDLSAKVVAKKLFVSMASLTRFAQKCGYSGYREFVYDFSQNSNVHVNQDKIVQNILHQYQQILTNGYHIIDEKLISQVVEQMLQAQQIYVYGIGSSGIAAHEMQYRLTRLGMRIEAIQDNQIMKINRVNLHSDVMVIGLSLSENKYVVRELKIAKMRGARTVLVTSVDEKQKFADYQIRVPSIVKLEMGNVVSPSFPLLLAIDIFYAYCLTLEPERLEIYNQTVGNEYKE